MQGIIDSFVKEKEVAVVGVSRSGKQWGNMMASALAKKGYVVYRVNPNADEIHGEKCWRTVGDLPKSVSSVILTVPSASAEQGVKDCAQAGIKRVWFHKGAGGSGSASDAAIAECARCGIEEVHGVCPLMFYPPTGAHRLHFMLKKAFRTLPKGFGPN